MSLFFPDAFLCFPWPQIRTLLEIIQSPEMACLLWNFAVIFYQLVPISICSLQFANEIWQNQFWNELYNPESEHKLYQVTAITQNCRKVTSPITIISTHWISFRNQISLRDSAKRSNLVDKLSLTRFKTWAEQKIASWVYRGSLTASQNWIFQASGIIPLTKCQLQFEQLLNWDNCK